MKKKIEKINQVLDEHLSAINENTGEIQTLFDYLHELEEKYEKLSQRLDQWQLSQNQPLEKPKIASLNQTERKVFLVLYTEDVPLSLREIAFRTELPLAIIPECISSLTNKGLPLVRSFFHNQIFLKLDSHFKELQAKENLVNLSLQSFL